MIKGLKVYVFGVMKNLAWGIDVVINSSIDWRFGMTIGMIMKKG